MINIQLNPLLVILGPTASGKTALAANAALAFNGEVISADSRQVYREMSIGTGKDLGEYELAGEKIPVHLLDIHPPGYKYNVYEFQTDFLEAYQKVRIHEKLPVMCGGSGMYIEAVLGGYKLLQVPVNEQRRLEWEPLRDEELIQELERLKPLHNSSDTASRKRLVRALEIAIHEKEQTGPFNDYPEFSKVIVGVSYPREELRERITTRLKQRFDAGMIEEVQGLLDSGISADDLVYYGLEYKYITLHLQGLLSYKEMFEKLNTSIHQFAKRQMTWFRKMEREGYQIQWLPGNLPMQEKITMLEGMLQKHLTADYFRK